MGSRRAFHGNNNTFALQPKFVRVKAGDAGAYAALGGVSSITRNLAAFETNVDGSITSIAINTLRDGHFVNGVRTILLEPAATNILPKSQTIDTWSASNASVIANTTTAPDGTVTADTVTDADAAHVGNMNVNATIANDSTTWCVSLFIQKLSSAPTFFPAIRVQIHAGTDLDLAFVLNQQTGAFLTNRIAGTLTASGIIDHGTFWRVWIAGPNVSNNGTSIVLFAEPAWTIIFSSGNSVAAVGSTVAWGCQAENTAFPTSYIPTVGASVTRGVDALSFVGATPFTGTLTLFSRFYDLATQTWQASAAAYTGGTAITPSLGTGGRAYSDLAILQGTLSVAQCMLALGGLQP